MSSALGHINVVNRTFIVANPAEYFINIAQRRLHKCCRSATDDFSTLICNRIQKKRSIYITRSAADRNSALPVRDSFDSTGRSKGCSPIESDFGFFCRCRRREAKRNTFFTTGFGAHARNGNCLDLNRDAVDDCDCRRRIILDYRFSNIDRIPPFVTSSRALRISVSIFAWISFAIRMCHSALPFGGNSTLSRFT